MLGLRCSAWVGLRSATLGVYRAHQHNKKIQKVTQSQSSISQYHLLMGTSQIISDLIADSRIMELFFLDAMTYNQMRHSKSFWLPKQPYWKLSSGSSDWMYCLIIYSSLTTRYNSISDSNKCAFKWPQNLRLVSVLFYVIFMLSKK